MESTRPPPPARTRAFGVIEDPRFQEHVGPPGHPERPARLEAVGRALAGRRSALRALPPRAAEDDELLEVHPREHLRTVTEAAARAPLQLDADTFVSPRSEAVARLAAGGAVDLARAVARGEVASGIAAVRPPGHHAEAARAMGFCLYNNVAVAARALQRREGVGKLLILDWDVHHGNGTQHFFEADPSVIYFSTHQYPYYPGTGAAEEAGHGAGRGATVNVPMPAGCGDDEYVGVFQRVLAPLVAHARPELILVSCGFDAHRDDPLAAMQVGGEGFRALASIVRALADDHCDGRLAFVLEGGYAASGLEEGTDAVLDAALAAEAPALPPTVAAAPGSRLAAIVARVAAVHGAIPGLGAAG